MKPSRSHVFAVLCLLLLVAAAVTPPLQAQTVSVLASGLNGPRGLKFGPDGALYVAEAGKGGPNLSAGCEREVPAPVGPYHGGPTARISRITRDGHVSTVVDALPSGMSSLPTGDTQGVGDVAFVDGHLFAILTGGGCSHGNPHAPNGVIEVNVEHGTWHYVANLSKFLKGLHIENPSSYQDDIEEDGTWYNMVEAHGDLYATDSNQEQIVRICPATGKVERIADVSASNTWVGPTALTFHERNFFDRGHLYFGNLGPFPVTLGDANIFKLTGDGDYKVVVPGFTTAVGMAFDRRDRLYVLELSAAAGDPTPGDGKLVRVGRSGEIEDILTGLVVPTALTIGPDGAIYISNFGAAPAGLGQILRVEVND